MELERVARLETQVEELKGDVKEVRDDIKELHSRITTQTREIVEKIDDFQTRMEEKMLSSAASSHRQHEAIKDAVKADIEKVAENLESDIREITKRVDILEKWRWMIVGGAIVIGYLMAHIDAITKILG